MSAITILTQAQFNKTIRKAVETGTKSRDLFRQLAENAMLFMLARNEDGSPSPSWGDTGRLVQVIEASENVKMINTTALKLWVKTFSPVTFDKDENIKWSKKAAAEFDIEKNINDALATPFWEFRSKVENKQALFNLEDAALRFVLQALKNGVSIDTLQAAVSAAAVSEKAQKQQVTVGDPVAA